MVVGWWARRVHAACAPAAPFLAWRESPADSEVGRPLPVRRASSPLDAEHGAYTFLLDEACTDSARVDRRDSCGPRRTSGGVDEADAKLTSMESMDFVCADCGNMIRYRDDTFRWRSQHKRTCRTWRTSLFNDELVVKGGLNSLRGATLRPSTSRASLTLVYSRPRAPRTLVSSRPASSRRRR